MDVQYRFLNWRTDAFLNSFFTFRTRCSLALSCISTSGRSANYHSMPFPRRRHGDRLGGYALIADSIPFPDRRFAGQSGIDASPKSTQATVARSLRQHDYVSVFQSGTGGFGHVDHQD